MKLQTNAGMSCPPHLQAEQPSVLIRKYQCKQSSARLLLAPARKAFLYVIGLKGWRVNKQPEGNSCDFGFSSCYRFATVFIKFLVPNKEVLVLPKRLQNMKAKAYPPLPS